MKESGLWSALRTKCKGLWIARRIESPDTEPGIADVTYSLLIGVRGWIELKHIHKYPVSPKTPIRIEHYTPVQKLFLWKEGNNAGYAFLFIQIERDYLLFDHVAAQNVGELTKQEMIDCAIGYWSGALPPRDFISKLSIKVEDPRRKNA